MHAHPEQSLPVPLYLYALYGMRPDHSTISSTDARRVVAFMAYSIDAEGYIHLLCSIPGTSYFHLFDAQRTSFKYFVLSVPCTILRQYSNTARYEVYQYNHYSVDVKVNMVGV